MALAKNPVVRVVVPLVLLAGAVLVAWAIAQNARPGTSRQSLAPTPTDQPQSPSPTTTPVPPPGSPATPPGDSPPPSPQPAGVSTSDQPPTPRAAGTTAPASPPAYRVRTLPPDPTPWIPVGSLDPASPYQFEFTFTPVGAGIERLQLTHHHETVDTNSPHELVQGIRVSWLDQSVLVPFAAGFITIDGRALNLTTSAEGRIWCQLEPGAFEAMVVDEADAPVARLTRRYRLYPGTYEWTLEQRVENLSSRPIDVQWTTFGPVDLPLGIVRYGGDKRRPRFGYLLDTVADPAQRTVLSPGSRPGLFEHSQALASDPKILPISEPRTLWPTPDTAGLNLVWAAMTNRYFAVAVHRPLDPTGEPPAANAPRALAWESVRRIGIPFAQIAPREEMQSVMGTQLASPRQGVAPGASADFSLGVYAGPMSGEQLRERPVAQWLGLDRLIVYTFGGPCAFCTFQPIAALLRWYLGLLHDYLVFDWAVAIVLLVVTIRTILHPVTKWSQVNIQRFAKQMQELAPKQKAIQEKYKNDPKKMREEITRLMRESNVNYTGLLGCIPAFLQTPVWIALAAMLFFTFELRHAGAFYGLFQAVTGGSWHFLADLAEPDNFIPLGTQFNVPLLSMLMGPIDSINVLPFLLGLVFYFHQKYLSPPPSAAMTEEQIAQQKIAKYIMVVSFPVFMYNAPAGLSLYFITNSLLAIVESHYIRKHVDELDKQAAAEGRKPWERSRKPGTPAATGKKGFLARLSERVEEKRKLIEQLKAEQERRGKQGGPGSGATGRPRPPRPRGRNGRR